MKRGGIALDFFISDNLKFLRKINNLSQEDLAKIVNYSFRTVSKWETGESMPSYDNLVTLSNFFNVSIDDLMKKQLSTIKDYHRYSTKLIDNEKNFLMLQKELFQYLFVNSNDQQTKCFNIENGNLVPIDYEFSDSLKILLKKEKINEDKSFYILSKAFEEMRRNSLLDYYEISLVEGKLCVNYKITM